MKSYRSHKLVKAAKIERLTHRPDSDGFMLYFDGVPNAEGRTVTWAWVERHMGPEQQNLVGGYFIEYPDGYQSWSPASAFEDGYTEEGSDGFTGLPVAGYAATQSAANVTLVNQNKAVEEAALRVLDELERVEGVDRRWLAIGRTHLEEGWMAVNRAIFKPGRVQLPGDQSASLNPGSDVPPRGAVFPGD